MQLYDLFTAQWHPPKGVGVAWAVTWAAVCTGYSFPSFTTISELLQPSEIQPEIPS